MLSTAIIVFREVIEAALIIGLVLTATRGVERRSTYVLAGIAAGLLGAGVLAVFADTLAQAAEGLGPELFNAGVLLVATAMLAWHNIWMAKHGRELAREMNAVGTAVSAGARPTYVLATVVALAVLREGMEVVLFVYGIAISGANSFSLFSGGLLGLAAGAAVGTALYLGLLRVPAKHLFAVTGTLIMLLAAGMAAQAAAFLNQAGWLPILKPLMWDSSTVLSERSLFGELLHTLIGYVDRPSGIQLLAYLATIVIIGSLTMAINRSSGRAPAVLASAALLIGLLSLLPVSPAHASHKVYYPTVEHGETEIELRGHVTHDNDRNLSNEQKYKLGVGHGFTDFWFAEIYAELERPAGTDEYEVESYELENLFRLTETGKYWADLGFLIEYSHASESGHPNKWELKPIVQKQLGTHLVTLNLNFERETGSNASDEWEFGYAWQYRLIGRPVLEFGLEGYGSVGELTKWDNSGDQKHEVGPAIFGKIKTGGGHAWKYRLALLFGLNDATPDATLTGMLEYEF